MINKLLTIWVVVSFVALMLIKVKQFEKEDLRDTWWWVDVGFIILYPHLMSILVLYLMLYRRLKKI